LVFNWLKESLKIFHHFSSKHLLFVILYATFDACLMRFDVLLHLSRNNHRMKQKAIAKIHQSLQNCKKE